MNVNVVRAIARGKESGARDVERQRAEISARDLIDEITKSARRFIAGEVPRDKTRRTDGGSEACDLRSDVI